MSEMKPIADGDELLRRSQVERLVGLRRSAIYRRIGEGTFPKGEPLPDSRAVRWRRSEVEQWLRGQPVG